MSARTSTSLEVELERYFGRAIEAEDRALMALSVGTRPHLRKGGSRPPHAIHVWTALLQAVPAIWKLHAALGYQPPDRAKMGRAYPGSGRPYMDMIYPIHAGYFETGDWQRAFRRLLRQSRDLTPAAREVQLDGHLTALRLARSVLWSSDTRLWPARTNLVLRYLARGAGYGIHTSWTPEIREVATRAETILTGLVALDESLGDQQFLVYHDGSRYKLAPFAAFDTFRLQPGGESGGAWVVRGNIVQPETAASPFSTEATGELEELINSGAPERDFQRFFEEWPQFLLALGPYASAHAQLVMRREDGTSLIPDFFLERLDSNFCDILDLKLPSVELVRRQKNRTRFRSAVMDSVAQLEAYRNWFDDRGNREDFRDRYGIASYRPRVVIIVGRRQSYFDEVEQIRLVSQLPAWVELKTYDDVLDQVERWRRWISVPQ